MKTGMVEAKVIASTIGSFIVSAAIASLNAVEQDSHLLGSLPMWMQALLITVIPAAITFLAGYQAEHSPRPDIPPANR